METLGSLRRTNYCGEVSLAMAGQEMTVCGSIARARDKGGIIFADLRDTTGILQLVFDEDTPKDVFAKAESLKSEYVIICRGKLRERAAKTDKISTGDVELYVTELRILSEAQTTPFELRDEINVNDDLRLRYRYLDLRRPSMHEPIVLRSKIMQIIRNYFCENHFTEIETPTLIKSTPEGARDYLVPSRVQPGHFYALPQSPQLYKQILMLSGFDRYFQLAHCYRDEDLRADRQPEFTQVDEEMSFVSEDDIMTLNEGLIKRLWKEMLNVDVETPFYRMPWDEAMGRFGSDKPDTRFGLEIQDVTEVFKGTEFKPFAAVLEAGGTIRAINAKGLADKLSRKNIDKLGEVAKTYGAKGLAYSRLTADGTSSSFEKFLTDAEKAALYAALNAETGDVLLLVSDTDWVKACTALGQVRLDIARKHGLIDPDKFNFLWVVDFPLFEYSEQEGRWMAMHHPFTLPKAEDLDKVESDPGACHAVAYDIVLNGVEMGGGSMRINDPALQDRMFHALGFTEEKAKEAYQEVLSLGDDFIVNLQSVAVVARRDNDKSDVVTPGQPIGNSTVWGLFWGMLFGLIFLIPFWGAAIGAGLGALTGFFVKRGVDEDFQDRVRNLLTQKDEAAVFMVVSSMTEDKFAEAMRPFGGDILQTSLSIKDEEELKCELGKC